jgi:hypothetical protein
MKGGRAATLFLAVGQLACGRVGYDPTVATAAAGSDAAGAARPDAPRSEAGAERVASGPPPDGSAAVAETAPAPDGRSPALDGPPPPADGPARPPDAAVAPPDAGVAAPDAPRDSPTGPEAGLPFSAPVLIAALANPSLDSSPTATEDLLEMYFQSDRVGRRNEYDIFVSTRASPSDPWGGPRMVAELSSAFSDETPEIAPDGLTLWFCSERGASGYDIYVSTRATRGATWGAPALVPELSSPLNDQAPTVSGSLRRMTLHSDRQGAQGKYDIFESTRNPNGTWSTPVPVVELNTTVYEGAPQLSPDDLVIYFDSNRPGGLGGWDIWTARRPTTSSPFGPATLVRGVSGARSDDGTPWVSADGRYMLLSSDAQIYEARR